MLIATPSVTDGPVVETRVVRIGGVRVAQIALRDDNDIADRSADETQRAICMSRQTGT